MSDNFFEGEPVARNPYGGNGELVTTRQQQPLGALASAEQQRALGELQAQIMLARMNPRDPQRCTDLIINDCTRLSMAEGAQYEYARGGTDIRGPSIKLMEAIARRWGNMQSGIKEISRDIATGMSECVAYAWDLETGYRDDRQFQVRHVRDVRDRNTRKMVQQPVVDERDIYELVANMGQRRKRACLQAIIPGDVVDAALEQCSETLAANVDVSVDGLKKLLAAFAQFGVTQQQIEQRIQCRLQAMRPAQYIQLRRIYTSLKDGMSTPSQWFRAADPEPERPTRQRPRPWLDEPAAKPGPKPEAAPEAAPEPQAEEPVAPPVQAEPAGVNPMPDPEEAEAAGEAAEEAADRGFEAVVVDDRGEPVDGEVHLDPLAYAQHLLLALRTEGIDRVKMISQNWPDMEAARALSEEADALLDGLVPEQEPAAEPEGEPQLSEDDRVSREILTHLATIKSPQEVIAYSNTQTVLAPIRRWQAEGKTGYVSSVRGAFTARLANLKAGKG